MTKGRAMGAVAALSLVCFGFAASSVHAAPSSNRAWVSGHGVDQASCGSPASPCRTFQYTHDNVIAPGGEIDVLDPAGYGAVTITKALSIVNDGVGTAGVQAASGDAITINAGASDTVTLRGLNIDGLGTGSNGIVFNSGGSLTVVNCVIRHFFGQVTTGNGILIQPTSGPMNFLISNVIVSDNSYVGVYFLPTSGTPSVTGAIDHVIATNSSYGIELDPAVGSLTAAISNTVASNNFGRGIGVSPTTSGRVVVSIDNSTISGNETSGVYAGGAAIVRMGRTVSSSNGFGVYNSTSGNTLYTYGDNRINDNGTDVAGTGVLNITGPR